MIPYTNATALTPDSDAVYRAEAYLAAVYVAGREIIGVARIQRVFDRRALKRRNIEQTAGRDPALMQIYYVAF